MESFALPKLNGKPSAAFFSRSDRLILTKPDSALRAYGLWMVPVTGRYRLHLECDDFGNLFLDGKERIRLRGVNARNTGIAEVDLRAGYHLLVLFLFNGPGQGWLTLYADHGKGDHPLLGGEALTPMDLSQINTWLRVVEGLKTVGWGGMLLGSAILILLAFIHAGASSASESLPNEPSLSSPMTSEGTKKPRGIIKKITLSFWVVLMVLGFLFHYNLFQKLVLSFPTQSFPWPTHPLTVFEHRLQEIKPYLPPRGTVGFISDQKDPAILFHIQYALSPLLVSVNTEPVLVIGLFHDPAVFRQSPLLNRFTILRDFQNGLFLLQRRIQ
ncbi:MAG: hypothetical protein AB1585_06985 [Thermodesulfobacteriota bacterium]